MGFSGVDAPLPIGEHWLRQGVSRGRVMMVSDAVEAAAISFAPRLWWVNHKRTYRHEVDGGYLWSPRTRADGVRNEFYENMLRVRAGDVVFSFADAAVRAVGTVIGEAFLAPKPAEFGASGGAWQDVGWRVPVQFTRLVSPLRIKSHIEKIAHTLPSLYSPIRKTGDGNQGAYLAAVPPEMATAVIGLLGDQWSPFVVGGARVVDFVAPAAGVEDDERAEVEIENRTDIATTEKLALVKARLGQGQYRTNLERFEQRCRVTGVSNRRHLRASHIKPWRVSTDHEKLDGNNGLLLSPHVDHLFDRGYISFGADGSLLASNRCDIDTLKRWSVVPGSNCGAFSSLQKRYLEYHQNFIFDRFS